MHVVSLGHERKTNKHSATDRESPVNAVSWCHGMARMDGMLRWPNVTSRSAGVLVKARTVMASCVTLTEPEGYASLRFRSNGKGPRSGSSERVCIDAPSLSDSQRGA